MFISIFVFDENQKLKNKQKAPRRGRLTTTIFGSVTKLTKMAAVDGLNVSASGKSFATISYPCWIHYIFIIRLQEYVFGMTELAS